MKKWEEIFKKANRALLKTFEGTTRQPFGKKPALIAIDVVKLVGSKTKLYLWMHPLGVYHHEL